MLRGLSKKTMWLVVLLGSSLACLVIVWIFFTQRLFFQPKTVTGPNYLRQMEALSATSSGRVNTNTEASNSATLDPAVSDSKLSCQLSNWQVPVLMYHYVEIVTDTRDTIRQSLDIQPQIFEQQLKTLQKAGYTFLTAADLAAIIDCQAPMPEKPILLTFDDGHRDFYTDVLPILERYQAKATVYVISSFIGGSDFMTADQVRSLQQHPLVEIGSHTVHHKALKGLPFATVEKEVFDSKQQLESNYQLSIVSFAYPDGSYDAQAENLVRQAGYHTAMATTKGESLNQDSRFHIHRLRPGNLTGEALLNFLYKNQAAL